VSFVRKKESAAPPFMGIVRVRDNVDMTDGAKITYSTGTCAAIG